MFRSGLAEGERVSLDARIGEQAAVRPLLEIVPGGLLRR
jgi:hypothetical protein